MSLRISTTISLVAGTTFLMWLGEQITLRGVGNGISLIIFSGIVAEIPRALASTFELGRTGALSAVMIVGIFVVGIVLLRLGFGEDLFKGGVVKTHERIVSIEQKMIDAYNLSNTPQDASKAITAAVAKLKKIKTENLDEEYKGALQDYIKALQKWSLALKRGDPIKADEFDDLRIDETRRLNEIYEKQPEVVTPLRF